MLRRLVLSRIRRALPHFAALFATIMVLAWCGPAVAQTPQFLPEIDTYLNLNSDTRVWFQAKQTREAGVPNQAEIGPSIDYYWKSLPKLAKIAVVDANRSESRVLVLSAGYRYLPHASGARGTNRMEPVATLQLPLIGGFVVSDRNRADLDWESGGFDWRYRNRLRVRRPLAVGSHRFTVYAGAEAFYLSRFQKWSSTDLSAGFCVPLTKKLELNPYYEHENNTGGAPNQQVNALGLLLNLYFSLH